MGNSKDRILGEDSVLVKYYFKYILIKQSQLPVGKRFCIPLCNLICFLYFSKQ